ncbi:MAG: heparan-alpha-glucosaminide N-acetyltransferase [Lachnospiraceae bacterium]
MKKTRYYLLDALRGLTVLSMVLYHLIWDLNFLYGHSMNWFQTQTGYFWQQSICWVFIFLSGFCFRFVSRPIKRNAVILLLGLLISVATWIAIPQDRVLFGILTFLGSAGLLMGLITRRQNKESKDRHAAAKTILFFLLFLILKNGYYGYLGFGSLVRIDLPDFLYQNLATAYLGFPPASFYSGDYFPLIPWFFLYLTGYFASQMKAVRERMDLLTKVRIPIAEWIGKRALVIYVLHQPALLGILYLWDRLFGI